MRKELMTLFRFSLINEKGYFYELTRDYEVYISELKGIYFSSDYLKINNGSVIILSGYRWNGASPKWTWLGVMWGTPDGVMKSTLKATLVHDALYQYGKQIGIKRSLADKVLYSSLELFQLKGLYYVMVRLFGWNSW